MTSSELLIKTLSQKIDEVLSPLIPKGVACAIIDFPNHSNSGDSAIWLGERAWLRKNENPIVYICDLNTYSREVLSKKLGEGIILLHGGGNFGDVWQGHQYFREEVIQSFPNNKIIQFPQTIFFNKTSNLEKTSQLLMGHPDLTLLTRDLQSFNIAKKELKVAAYLCPDMAFALGTIKRKNLPEADIVWLSRTDQETLNTPVPVDEQGILRTDWLEESPSSLIKRNEQLCWELKLHPEQKEMLYPLLYDMYDPIAQERFIRGCSILSKGKVVITDRLHGHIMCLLMGIPHILLDNNYGKVKGFYQTWTSGNELTVWANSTEDVVNKGFSDPKFRILMQGKKIELSSLDKLIDRLKASLNAGIGWVTAEQQARSLWRAQVDQLKQEILTLTPTQQRFILLDENQIRSELSLESGKVVSFLKSGYEYEGPPADDETAIKALESWLGTDVCYLIIAWPAFWYFSHYSGFTQYLRTNFTCLVDNERLVVFNLRSHE